MDLDSQSSNDTLKIFVGPEGVFVNADTKTSIARTDFDQETTGLREASRGILFIPGTVTWSKQISDQRIDISEKYQNWTDQYKATRPSILGSRETYV